MLRRRLLMLRRRLLVLRRRLEKLGSVTLTFTPSLIAPFAAPITAPFAAPFTAPVAAPTAAPTGPPITAPTIAPFTAPFTAPFFAPFTAPFFAPSIAPFTSIVAVTFIPNIDTDLLYDFLPGGLRLLRWSLSIPLKTTSSPTLHLSTSSRRQFCKPVFNRLATSFPRTPESKPPKRIFL